MRLPFAYPLHSSPSGRGAAARLALMIFSWQSLGVVLVAVMLARWVWVFAAPVNVAMPATTSWKKSNAADNLFGQPIVADANAAAAASNIILIGVFAHPTAGFAVLQIDGKQVGVGLGGTVTEGMRLVETHANYVLLDRGGVKQRVELQASSVASGITSATTSTPSSTTTNNSVAVAPTATEPRGTDEQDSDPAPNLNRIPPEQRAVMQQELDKFRRHN